MEKCRKSTEIRIYYKEIYSKIKKNTLLYYLDRFHTLVEKKFRKIWPFFHFILVQKVISRHIFPRLGALRPLDVEKNVSWNHFLNLDNMEQMVK